MSNHNYSVAQQKAGPQFAAARDPKIYDAYYEGLKETRSSVDMYNILGDKWGIAPDTVRKIVVKERSKRRQRLKNGKQKIAS
jgi:hypothetical protein